MTRMGILALAASIAACGGGTPAEVICGAYCDHYAGCGNVGENCASECLPANPQFENFSDSLASAIEVCVAESSCTIDPEALGRCITPKLEPTESTRAYCAEHVRVAFECGYNTFASDCEVSYAQFSDPMLDRLAQCNLMMSCKERDQCLQSIFDSL